MQKSQNQLSPGVRDGHWIHPYKLDDDVVKISASTKEIGRTIAFVPNITLCCTDDHHEQGRNRAEVEALGFAWINNPKKRVGSVQHTMVSVATGLIVGRDLERLGGSTNASTLRLIVSLGGRDRGDLNVPLNLTNRIDVDRGYRYRCSFKMNNMLISSEQCQTPNLWHYTMIYFKIVFVHMFRPLT